MSFTAGAEAGESRGDVVPNSLGAHRSSWSFSISSFSSRSCFRPAARYSGEMACKEWWRWQLGSTELCRDGFGRFQRLQRDSARGTTLSLRSQFSISAFILAEDSTPQKVVCAAETISKISDSCKDSVESIVHGGQNTSQLLEAIHCSSLRSLS
jgi:hypothetical protein